MSELKDRLDIISFIKELKLNWKFIVKVTVVFILIGLLLCFGTKPEYRATSRVLVVQQEDDRDLSKFSGLAGLAGIDLSSGSINSLSPEIYPEIIGSKPFLLNLWNHEIQFKNGNSTFSSKHYFQNEYTPGVLDYLKSYTIGLPALIISAISGNDANIPNTYDQLLTLSKKEEEELIMFADRMSVLYNENLGFIELKVEMPDPLAAAELNLKSLDLLTKYLIDFRTEKLQENVNFLQTQVEKSKVSFDGAQRALAVFKDSNEGALTSIAQIELSRLQYDFNSEFEVYSSLNNQLAQAEIQLQEAKPYFKILDPVMVPTDEFKPKKALIMIIVTVFGLLTAIGLILIRPIWSQLLIALKE